MDSPGGHPITGRLSRLKHQPAASVNPHPSTISLFIPCINDEFHPGVGMNMVRVLERLGLHVTYDARQTCCGQPMFNSGYHDEAAALACRFLDIFGDSECVVAPSGSCTAMVKVFYGTTLALPDAYREKADRLRSRIHEFTSFLVDVLGVTDVGAALPARVTVHDSCHALRELGIRAQPRALLGAVRGLELVEMPEADTCCGFGGTFAVKNAGISAAMAASKVESILATGAAVVTGVDSSCLMNIQGVIDRRGLPVRAMHIADILAREAR